MSEFLTIALADDQALVREGLKAVLRDLGFEIAAEAADGEALLEALAGTPVDVVVSDVRMPRMDGIALVRRIKADARLKGIPAMIVSYKDRPEDRLRGLDAGANYYLAKSSFHDESLLGAVRDLIGEA